MSAAEMLDLRFHFGERDRTGDRDRDRDRGSGPLEAAVMDACARRGVAAAVTLRGVEGFGAKQQLRTDRLLSLSEDAPLVVAAVGERERVEGLAAEVEAMAGDGLLVLQPVLTGSATAPAAEVAAPVSTGPGLVKATVWGPRGGAGSPHLGVVAALRARGADAATVLLGVDGVLEGERRRARFFAGNQGVPAITVALGERAAIEAALADLDAAPPLVTVEAVEGSSRYAGGTLHGGGVERNRRIATVSLHGEALHARVTLLTSEIAEHGAHPRYLALIHALREGGAAGATALRGVWGFRGEREPHGDRVLALRRDVPLLVETVDAPERAARWHDLASSFSGEDDVVDLQTVDRVATLDRVRKGYGGQDEDRDLKEARR